MLISEFPTLYKTYHVVQYWFYVVKLASIFTIHPEKDPKISYNSLLLRLYGLFHDFKKSVKNTADALLHMGVAKAPLCNR